MGLKWFGAERSKEVKADGTRRLGIALRELKNYAREHLSEVAYITAVAAAEGIRMTRRQRRREQAWDPAPPGGFPHKRTGNLRQSVDLEVYPDGKAGRYGTNVPYGKFLEVGYRKGKGFWRWPWMSLTNAALATRVRSLLTGRLD